MKKLLMLGTCKGSIEMLKTAKKKNIYTIVTDYLPPEQSFGKRIADEYWMINTSDVDALEKKCREEKIDGIITGVSEFNLERTMELTKRLGLQCYCTPEAWHYSRNKYDFKKLCKDIGVQVAEGYEISNPPKETEMEKVKYPVVVKAINLSGNRGMSYCYNQDDLLKACELARESSGNETIIVERMLQGPEVSAVYVMAGGAVRLLSFCSMYHQPGEPQNCYSISTTESRYLEKFLKEENEDVIRVLKAVGCKEGFAWVEMIIDEDGHFYLLEMGYRLCGDEINIPLRTVAKFDVHEWIMDYALGKKHSQDDLPQAQAAYYPTCGCVYSLWTNQEGKIEKIQGVEEITEKGDIFWDSLVREGDTVRKHMLIGEFMFEASDVYEMCDIIKDINSKIGIKNGLGEEMVIHYTDYDCLINPSRHFTVLGGGTYG